MIFAVLNLFLIGIYFYFSNVKISYFRMLFSAHKLSLHSGPSVPDFFMAAKELSTTINELKRQRQPPKSSESQESDVR